ncbi:MAG TPA: hypothetical protein VM049_04220 [Gaiellaceae bacterium]|nr:hypothetical protein [Gaiellaceae bacterium]
MSSAREVHRAGSQALAVTDTTVATMTNVAAGAYVISAKTIVEPNGGGPGPTVTCTLDAGGDTDEAALELGKNGDFGTLGMLVTHVFVATGSIVLRCHSTDTTDARATKIIAIKVDAATREAVTG